MKEAEKEELIKLLVVHARLSSHQDPKMEQMAEAQPTVHNSVVEMMEDRLRKLARKLAKHPLGALVNKLAAENEGLDFTATKDLLGL